MEFRIDEKKKQVVCLYKVCGKMFVGKAVCSSRDTFDKDTGCKIALLRARIMELETRLELVKVTSNIFSKGFIRDYHIDNFGQDPFEDKYIARYAGRLTSELQEKINEHTAAIIEQIKFMKSQIAQY